MKVSAIVYTSNTGFTAQYASLLSHQTGLSCYPLDQSGALPEGASVLYLGWLCAGSIRGLKQARRQFSPQAVCAVGIAPAPDLAKLAQSNHTGHTPLFYLRGGYAPARIKGVYRLMMGMMQKLMEKKSDPESRSMLECMIRGADWISQDQLSPVLDWLR